VSTRLRFLGVAGYEIVSPGSRILIDPFLDFPAAPVSPAELEPPDVILVSHGAFDHMGATAEIAARTGAPVVCGADVRLALLDLGLPEEQVRATVWGIVVEVGGVIVRPVECRHWSSRTLSDGRVVTGVPLAFIVEPEPGLRIYHYGDTAIFDMGLIAELYAPTVGLIGCAQPRELLARVPGAGEVLTGELSPAEAAHVARMLRVELAVAAHYIERDDPDVQAFLAATPGAVAPEVGETLVLEAPGRVLAPAVAS